MRCLCRDCCQPRYGRLQNGGYCIADNRVQLTQPRHIASGCKSLVNEIADYLTAAFALGVRNPVKHFADFGRNAYRRIYANVSTPVLKQQLQHCEAEIRNVMKAIRQGIITDTTKECLEDLESQRESLRGSIAQLQLERRKFSKEEIVDWISRYRDGNINDPEYRREIIDIFVNSVYVYDDKLILTYNYKDGSQTLTLQEVEAALSSDLTGMCPPSQIGKYHVMLVDFLHLCRCGFRCKLRFCTIS